MSSQEQGIVPRFKKRKRVGVETAAGRAEENGCGFSGARILLQNLSSVPRTSLATDEVCAGVTPEHVRDAFSSTSRPARVCWNYGRGFPSLISPGKLWFRHRNMKQNQTLDGL